MGMFGFLKKGGQPRSWHYSTTQGKMVPCASTPCRRHPTSDVIGLTEQEANALYAAKQRGYENFMDSRTGSVGMSSDPNAPVEVQGLEYAYRIPAAARDLSKPEQLSNIISDVFSYNGMSINGTTYFLGRKGRLLLPCPECNGSGYGKQWGTVCSACGGKKYDRDHSDVPSEVVYKQASDGSDRNIRYRAFVEAHRDEFNEHMIHVIRSGSYLANEGERRVYKPWFNKDVSQMMADRPDEAENMMRSMKSQYDSIMRDSVQSQPEVLTPGWYKKPNQILEEAAVTVLSSKSFTDKQGKRKTRVAFKVVEPGEYNTNQITAPLIAFIDGDDTALYDRGTIHNINAKVKGFGSERDGTPTLSVQVLKRTAFNPGRAQRYHFYNNLDRYHGRYDSYTYLKDLPKGWDSPSSLSEGWTDDDGNVVDPDALDFGHGLPV